MRALVAPSLGLILTLAATGCLSDTGLRSTNLEPTLVDDFSSFAIGETWEEGASMGGWVTEFDGYGNVAVRDVEGSPALTATPARADDPGMTHAAAASVSWLTVATSRSPSAPPPR